MQPVLVSVVIPAYNCEIYIAQAIRSVLAQTEQNFEIVIVDDASSDKTVEIIRSFSDQRISLYLNEQNRGVSHTRNEAFRMARGEWIALLDADDWYAPERIEKMLGAAREFNADMVSDDLYLTPADYSPDAGSGSFRAPSGAIKELRRLFPASFRKGLPRALTTVEFILGNMPGLLNLAQTKPLMRRDFLLRNDINYDEKNKVSEDTAFCITCLAHGALFTFLPEAYYFSREHRVGSLRYDGQKDPLPFYQHMLEVNDRLLAQNNLRGTPETKQALLSRHRALERFVIFFRFRQAIRTRSVTNVWKELSRHPSSLAAMLAFRAYSRVRRYLYWGT